MPIYSVGDSGNKELVFGTGDIEVSAGWLKDDTTKGVLVLQQQKEKPIGTLVNHDPNKEVEQGIAPVRMVFSKIESVDVFISELEKMKHYMQGDYDA